MKIEDIHLAQPSLGAYMDAHHRSLRVVIHPGFRQGKRDILQSQVILLKRGEVLSPLFPNRFIIPGIYGRIRKMTSLQRLEGEGDIESWINEWIDGFGRNEGATAIFGLEFACLCSSRVAGSPVAAE